MRWKSHHEGVQYRSVTGMLVLTDIGISFLTYDEPTKNHLEWEWEDVTEVRLGRMSSSALVVQSRDSKTTLKFLAGPSEAKDAHDNASRRLERSRMLSKNTPLEGDEPRNWKDFEESRKSPPRLCRSLSRVLEEGPMEVGRRKSPPRYSSRKRSPSLDLEVALELGVVSLQDQGKQKNDTSTTCSGTAWEDPSTDLGKLEKEYQEGTICYLYPGTKVCLVVFFVLCAFAVLVVLLKTCVPA